MAYLLNDQIEIALAALIQAARPTDNVYTGKATGDKEAPCWICTSQGEGEEEPNGTGNFFVNAFVQYKHHGIENADGAGTPSDPKGDNETAIAAGFAAIQVDNLPALMNAAATDLTVFPDGVTFMAPTSERDEEGLWIDTLGLQLYCCASALAA